MYNALAMLNMESLLIILVIVLVLFGGTKIPELLRGIGKGVGELQKGLDEGKRQLTESIKDAPPPPPAPAATQPTDRPAQGTTPQSGPTT